MDIYLLDNKTIYKIESGNLVHFYDLTQPVVKRWKSILTTFY